MQRQIKKPAFLYIFTLYAAVVAVAVMLLSGIFSWRAYHYYTDELKQRLVSQSVRLERTLTDTVDHTAYIMNVINEQIKKNPKNLEYIDNIISKFKARSQSDNLLSWTIFSWINKNYKLVVDATYGIMAPPLDLSRRDYVPFTKTDPGVMHLGAPVYGSTSRRWMIPGGVGVENKNGQYIGAMVIGFNIKSLLERMKESDKIDGVKFALLDNSLSPVLKSNEHIAGLKEFLQALKNKEVNNNPKQPNYISPIFKASLYSGKNHYLYHISKYPYYLYVSYNSAAVSHELWNALFSRMLEITVFGIVVLGLLILLYRRLIKPILALSETADSIAEGRYVSRMPRSQAYETTNLAAKLFRLQLMLKRQPTIKEQLELKDKLAHAIEASKESSKMRERFLRKLAEQAKAPLNTIAGTIELLTMERLNRLDKPLKDKEVLNYLRSTYQAIKQLKSFTTDALYITKADSKALLQECITIQTKEAFDHDIQIEATYADNLRQIYTDEIKFKQIFTGLIARALDFSPAGTSVHIVAKAVTKHKKRHLQVTIEDDGFGFDNTARADWTKEQERYGAMRRLDGVNLPPRLLDTIVGYLGGKITYKDIMTKGSTVTVLLPYRKSEEFNAPEKKAVKAITTSGNNVVPLKLEKDK